MSTAWDAAQVLLALAQDCLGEEGCEVYGRRYVDTVPIVHDCDTLAIQISNMRANGGSCAGRSQMIGTLDVVIVRCCDPVGELSAAGGYVPPKPEEIEAAAKCVERDAWAILACVIRDGCNLLSNLPGVSACCEPLQPPEIVWGPPTSCRSATVKIPIIITVC